MRRKKINIFFDGQIFYSQKYGGVSRYHAELYTGMKKRSCSIRIPVLFSRNAYLDNIGIKRRNPECKLFFNRYTKRMNEIFFKLNIKIFRPEIVHLTWTDPYLWGGKISAKKVVTIHDMIHEIFWSDTAVQEIANKKSAIYNSDKIIAISENTKKDILRLYPDIPEKKITVIYHGIDELKNEKKPSNLKIPDKYVLFVGQRGDYKNGLLLFKAMSNLLQEDKMLHLICIGGGKFTTEENQLLQKCNIIEKVHQYNVSDEELAYFYSHARCFVYPSRYEGFGMPVLEAFDKHTPVICAKTSSLPEVAGDAALYFDGESEEQLEACIKKFLYQPDKREEYIKKGIEQKTFFSWEKCVEETLSVYEDLM